MNIIAYTLLVTAAVFSLQGVAHADNTNKNTTTNSEVGTYSSIAPASGDASISANISRSDVRMVQETLNQNGYKVGQADGVMGQRTEAALRNFQHDKNISVTGTVTNETMAQLGLGDTSVVPADNFSNEVNSEAAPMDSDMTVTP